MGLGGNVPDCWSKYNFFSSSDHISFMPALSSLVQVVHLSLKFRFITLWVKSSSVILNQYIL